jgi:hypothetical protein
MSPDRTTITRAEAIRRRKEEEQNRKERDPQSGFSKTRSASTPKSEPKPASSMGRQARGGSPAVSNSRIRHRYDIAMSVPYGRARTVSTQKTPRFSISMPRIQIHPGPRLLSFFIMAFCALDLFIMFSMDPFVVRSAQIVGNKRISVQEIISASGALNQPSAFINPLQIEYNVRVAFPDVDTVQVDVNLPAGMVVTVSERKPMAAWDQNGKIMWIDARGYSFPARGEAPGLITITAAGDPPTPIAPAPVSTDTTATNPVAISSPLPTIGATPFLTSDLTDEIKTLSSYVPQGTALVFDPKYGLGWSDPAGWKVYFGHSNGDTALKLSVYQAMITYLSSNNLQPVLISVEYPNAPFYRLEQ